MVFVAIIPFSNSLIELTKIVIFPESSKEINLTTDKHLEKPLKVVMLSDIHAGYHNRRAEVGRWVDLVNAESPNLVLIAGDMIDGHARSVMEYGTLEELKRLNAPAIACLGNHEYITGIDQSVSLIEQAGITLLRDEAVTIAGVTIIGREDRSNYLRKSVKTLMQGVDRNRFIIMLDHQPYNLEETEHNGVDLQLSGHTHHGQVWPMNWVTHALYECDYGMWKRGKTTYYVSSGIGLWGGKFRIGTSSEYVVINISGS